MTRLAALFAAVLTTLPLIAAQIAPSSDTVGGLRRRSFLGAAVRNVDGSVRIVAAVPGSTAETIGLQSGDVVVSIDGQAVADTASFVAAVGKKRAGETLTLVLRRGDETITKEGKTRAAPLEKQADYDIDYGSVEASGSKRRVIVTRPRTAGKHPAVLLIGGIGCYSLDGILRPAELRDPYARLIDAWTRAGYVTMRVEKSGMGDSEGPPCADPRSDFNAEVRAYTAGLAQLESSEFVDSRNIVIFGHSIGPLVAAKVASEHPVRAIAVAETVGTSWMEYDLTNMRRQLPLSGVPYDEVDKRVRHHEVCAHRYYVDMQTPQQIIAADPTCAPDLELPAPYTYMQQVGALDLAPLWKKIEAPVLIIYGTADFVTDDYQARYLRDMINSFHPGRARYLAIEGMDHGLLIAGSQKAAMQAEEPRPFAQQVVDETLRFFNSART
jgi:pimeloyl-ACP methyl ester carboxylesterase